MILHISQNRIISDVQSEFNHLYPFLKIEFFKNNLSTNGFPERRPLQSSISINAAGQSKNGNLELNDSMTVGQLEKIFCNEFGLIVQTSRKSGTLWLETTMTDNWTLKQQNDHGKELSEPVMIRNIPKDRYLDEN